MQRPRADSLEKKSQRLYIVPPHAEGLVLAQATRIILDNAGSCRVRCEMDPGYLGLQRVHGEIDTVGTHPVISSVIRAKGDA